MVFSRTFFAMALANLSCLASFGTFFLFPLFVTAHGGDQVDIGIIMGAFALSSVLCRPWISDMIDRIGRKKSYAAGSLIMTLMPLAYLFFRGALDSFYLPLILVRVVHGVGFAICITAAFTYIADIIPKERLNGGLGMFGISGLAGTALGPVIAEILIHRAGFDILFIVAAAMSCVGLIIQYPLKETYVHVVRPAESSFFLVLQKRRVFMIAAIALFFGFGLAAVNGFVSPYASQRRISFISLYYIAYSAAAIVTRLVGGNFVDRLGEDKIIPYSLSLTGGGLMLLVLMKGEGMLFFSGLMTGCGHGLLYPALHAYAIRGEPQAIRGKITGAYTGSIDGGAFVGSIILGYVGELAGFPALFLAAGAVVLCAIFIFRRQTASDNAELSA
ncbi:MAG: MFS transporter [Syntrophobacteraceae bacterium]|jgi:MFS family permease